jgi:guanylate kinase
MRERLIFIISAPTGVGKTTLCKAMEGKIDTVRRVITHTTRKKRKEETEGVDYYFTSSEKFHEGIEKKVFVEWAEVHKNLYGTSKKALKEVLEDGYDVVLPIDVQGARSIKKEFPHAVLIFLFPPSFKEWIRRLNETHKKDKILRLKNALKELEKVNFFDYFIINDSIEQAISDLKCIVNAERQKISASAIDLREKINKLVIQLKREVENG